MVCKKTLQKRFLRTPISVTQGGSQIGSNSPLHRVPRTHYTILVQPSSHSPRLIEQRPAIVERRPAIPEPEPRIVEPAAEPGVIEPATEPGMAPRALGEVVSHWFRSERRAGVGKSSYHRGGGTKEERTQTKEGTIGSFTPPLFHALFRSLFRPFCHSLRFLPGFFFPFGIK